MGNDKKTKRNSNKIFALITYVLALICLLLGLFLPYNFEKPIETMIGLQLPSAFDSIYKIGEGLQTMLKTPAFDSALSFPVSFGETAIDLGAILLLLYGLIAVAGIFALIPVIVSSCRGKKKKATTPEEIEAAYYEERSGIQVKNVALRAASFIEAFAIMALSLYVFLHLATLAEITEFNYAILAAFGGTLLMLVVQAFFYKGGSGVMKFVLVILSSLAIILIFGVTFIIPPLADVLKDIDLNSLFTLDGAGVGVLEYVLTLITGEAISFEGLEITSVVLVICIMVFGCLAVVNFVLDLMGLGKKTNKFMLVVNIIRYFLEFAAIATILIMTFVIEGAAFGYLTIAFLVLSALSLILNIFRLVAYPKKRKAAAKSGKKAAAAGVAADEPKAPKESRKERKQPKPEKIKDEPVAVTSETREPDQQVYSPVIYRGETDDFINTLANEQKIEFSKVFLERRNGALPQIPPYVLGEKNEKFFSSVFIYYAKVRDLISDELMNMLYKQANIM